MHVFETLLLLLGVVVVSLLALAPNQGATALGLELLVESVAVIVLIAVLALMVWKPGA